MDEHRNNSVETLFIPEDPNQYEQILELVRELLGQSRIGEKIANDDKGDDDKSDRFSKVGNSRPSDGGGKDEEGVVSSTGRSVENNNGKEYAATSMERRKGAVQNGKIEPDEHDVLEAVNFGLDAMNELYTVKEPMLYSMGEIFVSSRYSCRIFIGNFLFYKKTRGTECPLINLVSIDVLSSFFFCRCFSCESS